jgi:membrane-associated protease RseP (regulator of RpoE activity)
MSESLRAIPTFAEAEGIFAGRRRATRPTAREWVRHSSLFLLTVLTTTAAGVSLDLPLDKIPEPALPLRTFVDYLLFIPAYYLKFTLSAASYAFAHPEHLVAGALFSASLLFILLSHEMGHYVACRLYGVDATLPYFIPAPPPFLVGTLGAFIKIRSPIPTRRALFDIGVAGPLAGFVALIPVALAGLALARPHAGGPLGEGALILNDPPFLRLLAPAFGIADLPNIAPNPFYLAAWVGLLVTSLNLMPVGQLDGGHATYALFGARRHALLGRAAFAFMLTLAPLGWLLHGAPSGVVYAILLFVMLRVSHPQAEDESESLGRARLAVAALTLLVFILSFTAFPITIL